MCQRLVGAENGADAGASLQFREQRLGGIQIGNVGIGRVGPDRRMHDFSGLARVHVESGFQPVRVLTGLAIAGMADGRWLVRPRMLMLENAMERDGGINLSSGRSINLSVGSKGLGFELLQQSLPFFVERRARMRSGWSRSGGVHPSLKRRNAFRRLADWTSAHVGRIVSMAMRTG